MHVVLAAHGSPDPRHEASVDRVAVDLATYGHQVTVGWIDHGSPALADAVPAAGEGACVVPYLLAHGYHARVDVAQAAGARPVAPVLGDDPAITAALLDSTDLANCDALVVAAVGSRDPEHARITNSVARQVAELTSLPTKVSYATTEPAVADVVASLVDVGHNVAVAPLILSPGILLDRLSLAAMTAGARTVGSALGQHPAVIALLDRRARGCDHT